MVSELGRMINNPMEKFSLDKMELQEGHIHENKEILDNWGEIAEIPETSEISLERFNEGTKILQPDMELIKTQSIESIKQSNIEKTQTDIKEDKELRELTEKEKEYLRENTRLSETAIENIRVDAEGNYRLKCRNEELAGKHHEITGVKYVEKTIEIDGIQITVVAPEFNPVFECKISAEMWESGDKEIFKYCTEQLRAYLETHPELKSKFTEQQLEQIMNGEPYIKGYTWHHSEIPGKMQLVETKVHVQSGHTGGNLIWCGGIR